LLLVEVTNWCNNPQLEKLDEIKTRLLAAAETVPTDRAGAVGSVAVLIARNREANPGLDALYQALLAEEKLPGVLLESFGTVAAVQEEWATADNLLARAAEAMPDSALVWNNRAVAVRKGFPQRLEESLRYADRAIELEDGNADFRETRGMIHYNLGNYEAAIEDLEIALNGVNRLELVKTTLADCYRRLGNDAVAELYEKQLARRQQ
jgi:tetratricopeptide (TPR) repeat protein